MSLLETHYDEGDGHATCDTPGPTTRDPREVTCPACVTALALRACSAKGALLLGALAATGVRKVQDTVNAAVRRDPVARGFIAGAAELLRADRELRGRRDPRKR
jgi:hypothetical protein